MCGIWYLTSKRELPFDDVLKSAKKIEHRGEDGYGSLVDYIDFQRFEKKSRERLVLPSHKEIRTWIVNYLYTTVGDAVVKYKNIPPAVWFNKKNVVKINVLGNNPLFTFLNGEFKVDEQRKQLQDLGFIIRSTNDTAVVGGYVQKYLLDGCDLMESVINTLTRISGAYAIIFYRDGESIIAQDVFGTRPLCLYISDNGDTIMATSESQAIQPIDPFYIEKLMTDHPYSAGYRNFIPGEVIRIKNHEIIEAYHMKKEGLLWRNSDLTQNVII